MLSQVKLQVRVVSGFVRLGAVAWGIAACGLSACGPAASVPPGEPAAAPSAAGAAAPKASVTGGAESSAPAPGSAPTVAPSASAPAAMSPLPDAEAVRGTTVLQFGDSFAGALGIDLNRQWESHGVRGKLRYRTSSFIPDWAWREPLEDYLRQYDPDLVLINVGANELQVPDPAVRIPAIRKIVERVGDRPCVWVGVPLWDGARPDLVQVIRDNCAPCLFMDSTALVPGMERAADDIHPSMSARVDWAKVVIQWLLEHRAGHAEQPWKLRSED